MRGMVSEPEPEPVDESDAGGRPATVSQSRARARKDRWTDGPFSETKEHVGGAWPVQVSKPEPD
jgi:hypothetical protein